MTDTTFTDGVTPIVANWLNEINDHVHHDTPITPSTTVHNASVISNTPAGNISATNIQAAINELDTEKQPLDSELTAISGLTSAANKVPRFTGSGTAEVIDVIASNYVPTVTVSTNASAAGLNGGLSFYTRLANIVTVSVSIQVQATAGSTLTRAFISLPIATNLATTAALIGVGCVRGVTDATYFASSYIYEDTINDRALVEFISSPTGTGVQLINIQFTYQI